MRRMADPVFRADQWENRYAEHVAPLNRLVDELRDQDGRGWLPYVAPFHGGAQARVLSVLRDPGPMTQELSGSGLLCIENDDQTAQTQAQLFADAGLSASDVTPWNAYPWYINRAPKAAELDAGVEPLVRVLDLIPNARVVLLQGGEAKNVWQRLLRRYPRVSTERRLEVLATYHPSNSALQTPYADVRQARRQHRRDTIAQVVALLK